MSDRPTAAHVVWRLQAWATDTASTPEPSDRGALGEAMRWYAELDEQIERACTERRAEDPERRRQGVRLAARVLTGCAKLDDALDRAGAVREQRRGPARAEVPPAPRRPARRPA